MVDSDGLRNRVCYQVGISRSYLYQPLIPTKLALRSAEDVKTLKSLHQIQPLFGVRRLALALNWSCTKTRRIRNLAGVAVAPYRSRPKRTKLKSSATAPSNLLLPLATYREEGRYSLPQATLDRLSCWCVDFTYLRYRQSWLYLSAVFDLRSRLVLNFSLNSHHRTSEQLCLLKQTLNVWQPPSILHSDQGVEYLAGDYRAILQVNGIEQSCSQAGKPWQNGHLERAFLTLKDELGIITDCQDTLELQERLRATIFYYNHHRRHSTIKSTPYAYYLQHLKAGINPFPFTRQNTLEKTRS